MFWVRIVWRFRISVRFGSVRFRRNTDPGPPTQITRSGPQLVIAGSPHDSDCRFGIYAKFGVGQCTFGCVRVFVGPNTSSDPVFGPTEPQNRVGACIWAHKYPNTPGSTLPNAKFCVDSKSPVRFVRATRNHELRAQTGNLGRRARIGIPTEPNRTEPIFGISIKF